MGCTYSSILVQKSCTAFKQLSQSCSFLMQSNIVLHELKHTYTQVKLQVRVKCIPAPKGIKRMEKITGSSDSPIPCSQSGTPHQVQSKVELLKFIQYRHIVITKSCFKLLIYTDFAKLLTNAEITSLLFQSEDRNRHSRAIRWTCLTGKQPCFFPEWRHDQIRLQFLFWGGF